MRSTDPSPDHQGGSASRMEAKIYRIRSRFRKLGLIGLGFYRVALRFLAWILRVESYKK